MFLFVLLIAAVLGFSLIAGSIERTPRAVKQQGNEGEHTRMVEHFIYGDEKHENAHSDHSFSDGGSGGD